MLVLPKWEAMWLESQHCSKSVANVPLSSKQSQKVLEDLRTNCCSSNKAVQLEALKCWGVWIKNQNSDDWKLNTVCFTAIRPLIAKKLQPLQKDVDICKMRLRLMWALLIKVQYVMHLEGPQYILEVFLQSCLTWLNSVNEDGCENEISVLIFQLLLAVFKKDENLSSWDNETIPPLSVNVLSSKKVFHRLADKFLNIFIHWNKVQDKTVILKLWKYFLELCELSCEQIPIPIWHKIFKLASQICSEKSYSIKERLAFLHSCSTVLKSVLTSSKFLDYGNLMTTPSEALLKKLVELCRVECNEFCDSEMFFYSKEICQVLSVKSVGNGGYEVCISTLDMLEEFWLKSLFWGVWCGLVYCYKVRLSNQNKNLLTGTEMKFYRKLRGVAVNFELDRNYLHEDCVREVEKHIELLNITCLCVPHSVPDVKSGGDFIRNDPRMEVVSGNKDAQLLNPLSLLVPVISRKIADATPRHISGIYSTVALHRGLKLLPRKTVNVKINLIKNILNDIGVNCTKPLFNCLFNFRFFTFKMNLDSLIRLSDFSLQLSAELKYKNEPNLIVSPFKRKPSSATTVLIPVKKNANVPYERHRKIDSEGITSRKTRSKVRAEEENKKAMENREKRKRRKSFEVLVQEIFMKNKERKTEKNNRRKSPIGMKNKQKSKKEKTENKRKTLKENIPERNLRNSKKEEPKNQKKKEKKADGKLENYFTVISKKAGNEVKKKEKKAQKGKKNKGKAKKTSCCQVIKDEGEIGWKQTSLKTMMNQKRKHEKIRQGGRSRNRINVSDENQILKANNKIVTESSLATLSPFKEVFHDHEYAKMEFQNLETYEKVLLAKEAEEVGEVKKTIDLKLKPLNLQREEFLGTKVISETKSSKFQESEKLDSEDRNSKTSKKKPAKSEPESIKLKVLTEEGNLIFKKVDSQEEKTEVNIKRKLDPVISNDTIEEQKLKEPPKLFQPNITSIHFNSVNSQESLEESDVELTPSKQGKKRVRMIDSLKPSKKIKFSEKETENLMEITEKENLEENQPEMISPSKKDKMAAYAVKNDRFPRIVNGTISSRALRMIALVPESTKGSQMQFESPSRVEVLKFKKGPNVDKNSRASKMLALLSENVVELDEEDDVKVEEVDSSKLSCAGNASSPVSSLKSPKSMRKRRSIRFDDTKNETVLFQTDTPPSQIHQEKEKCRRIRSTEIILNLL